MSRAQWKVRFLETHSDIAQFPCMVCLRDGAQGMRDCKICLGAQISHMIAMAKGHLLEDGHDLRKPLNRSEDACRQ